MITAITHTHWKGPMYIYFRFLKKIANVKKWCLLCFGIKPFIFTLCITCIDWSSEWWWYTAGESYWCYLECNQADRCEDDMLIKCLGESIKSFKISSFIWLLGRWNKHGETYIDTSETGLFFRYRLHPKFHSIPYILCSALRLIWALWALVKKVVHYVGNKVLFGMWTQWCSKNNKPGVLQSSV